MLTKTNTINNNNKYDYNYYYKKANKELLNENYESAIENYKQSLNFKNNNLECLYELGQLYKKLNRFEEAIVFYKRIVELENNMIKLLISLNEIGVFYSNLCDYSSAIEYFEKVLQIKNDIQDVHNNLAHCYLKLKNYGLCEKSCYNSLRIAQNDLTLQTLGELYLFTKKYDISKKCYEKISDLDKNSNIKYNYSFPHLASKNFSYGFKLYENRLANNNICTQTKQKQRVEIPQIEDWDGKKPCKSLLVVYEQGIGDNIQYYRFLIELAELYPYMRIDYFCKETVSPLFKQFNNLSVIQNVIVMQYEYKIFIMSLPYILNISEIKPNIHNYININNNKLEYWKNELSHLKKFRVGITNNGLLTSIIDKHISLPEFNILFDSNIDFICINRLNEVDPEHKNLLKDKITFLDIDKDVPFEDTVAILNNIDLLLTVDTYIVHLAGVLNIKTLLLLGYTSDWRWFNDDVCLWYKSVEIMRLKENKEFKNILINVKEKLDNILSNKNN